MLLNANPVLVMLAVKTKEMGTVVAVFFPISVLDIGVNELVRFVALFPTCVLEIYLNRKLSRGW
jgi:hypothetical protein